MLVAEVPKVGFAIAAVVAAAAIATVPSASDWLAVVVA